MCMYRDDPASPIIFLYFGNWIKHVGQRVCHKYENAPEKSKQWCLNLFTGNLAAVFMGTILMVIQIQHSQ